MGLLGIPEEGADAQQEGNDRDVLTRLARCLRGNSLPQFEAWVSQLWSASTVATSSATHCTWPIAIYNRSKSGAERLTAVRYQNTLRMVASWFSRWISVLIVGAKHAVCIFSNNGGPLHVCFIVTQVT